MAGDDANMSTTQPTQQQSHLARVRDNQRRSRARRKEYLQDLEEKFRRCEQQGVEASTEMQQAARRVLEENKRLKAALRERGLSEEEIEDYAKGSEIDSAAIKLEDLVSNKRPYIAETPPVDYNHPRRTESASAGSGGDSLSPPGVSQTTSNGSLQANDHQSTLQQQQQEQLYPAQAPPFQSLMPYNHDPRQNITLNTTSSPGVSPTSPTPESANSTTYINSFPSTYQNYNFVNGHHPQQTQQHYPTLPSNDPWSQSQQQILHSNPTSPAYSTSPSGYPPMFTQQLPHHPAPGAPQPGYYQDQQANNLQATGTERKASVQGNSQPLWSQEQWEQQRPQQQRPQRPAPQRPQQHHHQQRHPSTGYEGYQ